MSSRQRVLHSLAQSAPCTRAQLVEHSGLSRATVATVVAALLAEAVAPSTVPTTAAPPTTPAPTVAPTTAPAPVVPVTTTPATAPPATAAPTTVYSRPPAPTTRTRKLIVRLWRSPDGAT